MHNYWFIMFMIVIGAVIGGMTNSLAIKMLFRPYKEIQIGKWRVPFTPGLIPKRHDELATQLGKMVVQYLLTAEGLGKKLKSAMFFETMTKWFQAEVKKILHSDKSLALFLEEKVGITDAKKRILGKTDKLISSSIKCFFDENRHHQLAETLPQPFQQKIQEFIPTLATFILERGQTFLSSPEGKKQLSYMIDRFLADKGALLQMMSMFLGNERLVDKVQLELLKFLQDRGTKGLVENVLRNEWERFKTRPVQEIEEHIKKEEVVSFLVTLIEKNVPAFQWIEQPMKEWTPPFEVMVSDEWVPVGIELLTDILFEHLETLLEKFHLEEIVREQVKAFSVERLEELVLSISKKEFKMITYLGALLGGVIGLIQAFVVLFIG